MNAEDFYAEYKAALDYLGVRWGQKDQVEVAHTPAGITMTLGPRTATILLPGINDVNELLT